MSEGLDVWVAEQRDRWLIERTIRRYFEGLDRGDMAFRNTTFAPHGRMFVEGVQRLGPGAPPPEQIAQPRGLPPADQILGFTHCMHQCDIRLDGDRAFGEVYATACLIVDVGAGPKMLVRAIRYIDRYVRLGDDWLIEERHHHVDWMFEAPATLAVGLSERETFPAFLAANGMK